jgi:hypothetical protein
MLDMALKGYPLYMSRLIGGMLAWQRCLASSDERNPNFGNPDIITITWNSEW